MSSPISRTDSPSLDEHKRKREELSKKPEGTSTSEIEGEGDAEAVPPKKIKPEVDAGETVSKAEVKQIQRNLKTMPLEDNKAAEESKDMDDVESDLGSAEDGAQDKQMESSSQPTPIKADTPDESQPSPPSDVETEAAGDSNGAATKTTDHTTTTTSGVQPKLGSGFSNTSSASPFANVKPGENVFGSSSATLKGMSATSAASPFANVDKTTNVFGSSKPSAFSGGFSNTSSVSPFATMASSTNVFGGESAKDVFGGGSTKSVFGQNSSTSTPTFGGSAFGGSPESTSGSVFGTQSVVGSVAGAKPSSSQVAAKFTSTPQSKTAGTFSTFGAKNTFGAKDGGFATGSFLGKDTKQEQADFGEMLSQNDDKDDDPEQPEETEPTFGVGVFTNADQIDVQTGEENEMTIYQTKGKLYADAEKTHSWKERGKGTFKVNVGRNDTKLARLVMRTDGVLRVILNTSIFPEMNVTISGDKYVRFMGVEDGKLMPFLLKVKDAAVAEEVVHHIHRASERQVKGKGQGVVLRD